MMMDRLKLNDSKTEVHVVMKTNKNSSERLRNIIIEIEEENITPKQNVKNHSACINAYLMMESHIACAITSGGSQR